jgi:hypothetical protein
MTTNVLLGVAVVLVYALGWMRGRNALSLRDKR